MLRPEFGEEFSGGLCLAASRVFQSLADAFLGAGAGGNVEQALVGFRVLHHCRGFAVDSENDGTFVLFELL